MTTLNHAAGNDPTGRAGTAAARRLLSAGLLVGGLSWGVAAAAADDALDMKVSVKCQHGDVVFMIVNRGKAWPEAGVVSVYWTEVTRLVHERRLKLGAGQRVSFRVPGVAGNSFEFGLWVNPSWFKRPFDYDARIKCG